MSPARGCKFDRQVYGVRGDRSTVVSTAKPIAWKSMGEPAIRRSSARCRAVSTLLLVGGRPATSTTAFFPPGRAITSAVPAGQGKTQRVPEPTSALTTGDASVPRRNISGCPAELGGGLPHLRCEAGRPRRSASCRRARTRFPSCAALGPRRECLARAAHHPAAHSRRQFSESFAPSPDSEHVVRRIGHGRGAGGRGNRKGSARSSASTGLLAAAVGVRTSAPRPVVADPSWTGRDSIAFTRGAGPSRPCQASPGPGSHAFQLCRPTSDAARSPARYPSTPRHPPSSQSRETFVIHHRRGDHRATRTRYC